MQDKKRASERLSAKAPKRRSESQGLPKILLTFSICDSIKSPIIIILIRFGIAFSPQGRSTVDCMRNPSMNEKLIWIHEQIGTFIHFCPESRVRERP